MELNQFIVQIEDLIKSNKPNQIIPFIKNVKGFVESLKKLSSMIGMKDFKNNIVSQIKYYFLNQVRLSKDKTNIDTHMFHTVLLGPPGSGKTTAAEILADLWMDLGLLKQELSPKTSNLYDSHIVFSETYKILEKEKIDLKFSNDKLQKNLNDTKIKLNSIKTEIITEKNKIENIKEYLQQKKNELDTKINFTLQKKLMALESGYEFIVKKYANLENIIIPRVLQEDYEIEDQITKKRKLEDNSSVSSASSSSSSLSIPKFIKLRRDDLIGKYIGHTAIKTREALMNGLGKVIFIDEAYELYNVTSDSTCDSFGMECLSAILNFMNEFSDKTIIIFAGYEDLLKKTIFRVQPGLERRIAWTFTLSAYSEEELVDIYEKQLSEKSWILKDKEKILKLFKHHKKSFKHGGGDTLRLAMYTKTVYSDICFELLLQNKEINSCIGYEIVSKALDILKDTTENQKSKDGFGTPPENMYV
jgi:DNA polymerase III delta prime subunit